MGFRILPVFVMATFGLVGLDDPLFGALSFSMVLSQPFAEAGTKVDPQAPPAQDVDIRLVNDIVLARPDLSDGCGLVGVVEAALAKESMS